MQSSTLVAAILSRHSRPGRISVTLFCPTYDFLVWLRLKLERAGNSVDDNSHVELNDRLKNALWCTCERFVTMLMQRECVCCREKPE